MSWWWAHLVHAAVAPAANLLHELEDLLGVPARNVRLLRHGVAVGFGSSAAGRLNSAPSKRKAAERGSEQTQTHTQSCTHARLDSSLVSLFSLSSLSCASTVPRGGWRCSFFRGPPCEPAEMSVRVPRGNRSGQSPHAPNASNASNAATEPPTMVGELHVGCMFGACAWEGGTLACSLALCLPLQIAPLRHRPGLTGWVFFAHRFASS